MKYHRLFLCMGMTLSMLWPTLYGQSAKVIGYLPTYRFSSSKQVDFCKLTHLNLAFANPDSSGNIHMPDISSVVADAQAGNPDILIGVSFAGAALSEEEEEAWAKLIDIPANRPDFISKIIDFALSNKLNGVDIDLEWGHVTSGYSDFIVELKAALDPHEVFLSAAFPNQKLFSNVSQAALEALDFINIMSYDATGPWNPASPGPHSSYEFSVAGINFWKNSVGVPGEKLALGVPFYGYDFIDASTVNAFTYASMVATDVSYADRDEVGTAYYNGRPTIEAKVELSHNELSGTMIWELGQDSYDEYSLLKTIHDAYTALEVFTTGLCGNDVSPSVVETVIPGVFKIYPNPASEYLMITHEFDHAPQVFLSSTSGQILHIKSKQMSSGELQLNLMMLENGLYFITLSDKEGLPLTQKLIIL